MTNTNESNEEKKKSCELTDNKKEELKRQIIAGAKNYDQYLLNKVFKIVCEDGTAIDIRFFQNDFKHLTGLYSNLSDGKFFKFCRDGIIDIGNIETVQKYNWSTLKGKGQRISHIHEMLYQDGNLTLLLECLKTNTYPYPYAIRNDVNDICVCFVDTANKAKSLRKAHNSTDAKVVKHICSIFAKKTSDKKYSEIVYLGDKELLLKNNSEIINALSDNIKNIIVSPNNVNAENKEPVNITDVVVIEEEIIETTTDPVSSAQQEVAATIEQTTSGQEISSEQTFKQ